MDRLFKIKKSKKGFSVFATAVASPRVWETRTHAQAVQAASAAEAVVEAASENHGHIRFDKDNGLVTVGKTLAFRGGGLTAMAAGILSRDAVENTPLSGSDFRVLSTRLRGHFARRSLDQAA